MVSLHDSLPEVFLILEIDFGVVVSIEEFPFSKEIAIRGTNVTITVASRAILIEIPNEVRAVVSLAIAAERDEGLTICACDPTIVGALEPIDGFEAGLHVVREQRLSGVAVEQRAILILGVGEAPVAGRSASAE